MYGNVVSVCNCDHPWLSLWSHKSIKHVEIKHTWVQYAWNIIKHMNFSPDSIIFSFKNVIRSWLSQPADDINYMLWSLWPAYHFYGTTWKRQSLDSGLHHGDYVSLWNPQVVFIKLINRLIWLHPTIKLTTMNKLVSTPLGIDCWLS